MKAKLQVTWPTNFWMEDLARTKILNLAGIAISKPKLSKLPSVSWSEMLRQTTREPDGLLGRARMLAMMRFTVSCIHDTIGQHGNTGMRENILAHAVGLREHVSKGDHNAARESINDLHNYMRQWIGAANYATDNNRDKLWGCLKSYEQAHSKAKELFPSEESVTSTITAVNCGIRLAPSQENDIRVTRGWPRF